MDKYGLEKGDTQRCTYKDIREYIDGEKVNLNGKRTSCSKLKGERRLATRYHVIRRTYSRERHQDLKKIVDVIGMGNKRERIGSQDLSRLEQ